MAAEASLGKSVLWGATGQAKVLAEIIGLQGGEVIHCFERDPTRASPRELIPISYGLDGFHAFVENLADPAAVAAFAAIGGARGRDRLTYLSLFREAGLATPSAIHPAAWVSPSAIMGAGCQILAQACVSVEVAMGDGCIANTGSRIDHECRLGHGVHIGPGATLAGCVRVEDHAFIGAGATILPRVSIGTDAIIGAGAVVTRDVPPNTVVAGCPARPIPTKTT